MQTVRNVQENGEWLVTFMLNVINGPKRMQNPLRSRFKKQKKSQYVRRRALMFTKVVFIRTLNCLKAVSCIKTKNKNNPECKNVN
jgi:hypothetical protein